MCPRTPAVFDVKVGHNSGGELVNGAAASYVVSSLGVNLPVREEPLSPTPISFRPEPPPPPPPSRVVVHPAFDTAADREMTRAITEGPGRGNANGRGGVVSAQGVKILGGPKEGFKIHLNGQSGQDSCASIQGAKGHNYVITPAGAAQGENIAINGGGLYIRARNNKKQLITATSCPDNQVQVQVGQGKSAVQLSVQVAPQGKRGEVELNCVRSEGENGGTGYTVHVNREAEHGSCSNKQISVATAERGSWCDSTKSHVLQGQVPQVHSNYATCPRTPSSIPVQPHTPDQTHDKVWREKDPCVEKRLPAAKEHLAASREQVAEKNRQAEQEQRIVRRNYAEEQRIAQEQRIVQRRHAEQARFADKESYSDSEDDDNWLYKRKLDLHHHKPTISYLIGRRMTELFKEMRRTSELHPPAPPFVKF